MLPFCHRWYFLRVGLLVVTFFSVNVLMFSFRLLCGVNCVCYHSVKGNILLFKFKLVILKLQMGNP